MSVGFARHRDVLPLWRRNLRTRVPEIEVPCAAESRCCSRRRMRDSAGLLHLKTEQLYFGYYSQFSAQKNGFKVTERPTQ